jgi:hypothetical protein
VVAATLLTSRLAEELQLQQQRGAAARLIAACYKCCLMRRRQQQLAEKVLRVRPCAVSLLLLLLGVLSHQHCSLVLPCCTELAVHLALLSSSNQLQALLVMLCNVYPAVSFPCHTQLRRLLKPHAASLRAAAHARAAARLLSFLQSSSSGSGMIGAAAQWLQRDVTYIQR